MFRPNQNGATYQRVLGRDIHSRPTLSAPAPCPFGIIRLPALSEKTDKRADSSASRGAAEEVVLHHGKILVPTFIQMNIGDRFSFRMVNYIVAGVEPRYAVNGKLDHYEISLEITPV